MTLATPEPARPADHLPALLCTVPASADEARDRLHATLEAAAGCPVSVLRQGNDGRWALLAGPRVKPAAIDSGGRRWSGRMRWYEAGDVGVVTHDVPADDDVAPVLQQACAWLSLVLSRGEAVAAGSDAGAESRVLQQVIDQLLRVRDLDQALLSITDRTLTLLDADICGVLLREGDELRMRSCTGHRVVDTARLRMGRGQGVAGLVFLTGKAAKVDDYVRDPSISQDFVPLAELEQARSALAAPLTLHGEIIGVLEVWRRRPSLFTEDDVRRIVTLADAATIAIDNARLYDEQAAALEELSRARDTVEAQLAVHQRTAHLQRTLLTAVLEGEGLPTVTRVVAQETECRIAVYFGGGQLAARYPTRLDPVDLPSRLRMPARPGRHEITLTDGTKHVAWVHPLVAEGDELGCVALLPGREPPEVMDVVAGQAAMACSLMLLRQRAAGKARAEALEQVVWDLVQGNAEQLAGARSRAKQLGVPLDRPMRLVCGRLDKVDDVVTQQGWTANQADRMRRDILRALRQRFGPQHLLLAAHRADTFVAVVAGIDAEVVRERLTALSATIHEDLPGLCVSWGVSREDAEVGALPRSFEEARVAAAASRRLGGDGVCLYEQLGIVRLLLGSGHDPDLQQFVDDVTGPLLQYDRDNAGSLLMTLRAFFDADCSQRAAAERLFVHHKTMRYRMEKIRQLTGLDLAHHEDRMRADFALRLLQVSSDAAAVGESPQR
jgi:sugar diacid utilization regulator/putative methionine-R-sulfoxide reductase with GAF domain